MHRVRKGFVASHRKQNPLFDCCLNAISILRRDIFPFVLRPVSDHAVFSGTDLYTKRCLSGCTHTSEDETRGRVCDESCETGDPYGTRGCGAREGRYGENCRVCYYDLSLAVRKDQPDNHVIM